MQICVNSFKPIKNHYKKIKKRKKDIDLDPYAIDTDNEQKVEKV